MRNQNQYVCGTFRTRFRPLEIFSEKFRVASREYLTIFNKTLTKFVTTQAIFCYKVIDDLTIFNDYKGDNNI